MSLTLIIPPVLYKQVLHQLGLHADHVVGMEDPERKTLLRPLLAACLWAK